MNRERAVGLLLLGTTGGMYACDDGLNEHWIPNRAFRLQIILAIRAVVDSVAVRGCVDDAPHHQHASLTTETEISKPLDPKQAVAAWELR